MCIGITAGIVVAIINTSLAMTLLLNYCLMEKKDLIVFIPPIAIYKFLTVKPL